MILEYNRKIAALPPGPNNPEPLSVNMKDYLDKDSALFDLERFRSGDRWAKEPGVRRAIMKLKEWDRCEEELKLLTLEFYRFIYAQRKSLKNIQEMLGSLKSTSDIHEIILEMGARSALALRQIESGPIKGIIEHLLKSNSPHETEFRKFLGDTSTMKAD